jgi:hypothetical protein
VTPPEETDARDRVLAYEDTLRVLNRQATVLSELRTRANFILGANGVVAGLFGAGTIIQSKHPHPRVLAILAVAVLLLSMGLCVAVLWSVRDEGEVVDPEEWPTFPRWFGPDRPRRWRVSFALTDVIDFHRDRRSDLQDDFKRARSTNWRTIECRSRYFKYACLLLPVQVGLWSALLLAR